MKGWVEAGGVVTSVNQWKLRSFAKLPLSSVAERCFVPIQTMGADWLFPSQSLLVLQPLLLPPSFPLYPFSPLWHFSEICLQLPPNLHPLLFSPSSLTVLRICSIKNAAHLIILFSSPGPPLQIQVQQMSSANASSHANRGLAFEKTKLNSFDLAPLTACSRHKWSLVRSRRSLYLKCWALSSGRALAFSS